MILSVSLGMLVLLATGTYLLLSRDVFRAVVGISILGSAVNLVVFASGRLMTGLPPIMQVGDTTLSRGANPLPQALVLTAIVIGFALTCFALVLCVTIVRHARTNDLLELTFAEPIASVGVKPPLEGDAVSRDDDRDDDRDDENGDNEEPTIPRRDHAASMSPWRGATGRPSRPLEGKAKGGGKRAREGST